LTNRFAVAIDGPAGSGKSSVARAVAERYGCVHLDSGAFYRAVALFFRSNNIDLSSDESCEDALGRIHFSISDGSIFLNGTIVNEEIRTIEISQIASLVSAKPSVRIFVTETIRELVRNKSVVMDGRDIGTVVLPDAEVKIYVTASLEERAKRRQKELGEKGISSTIDDMLQEIQERDQRDTTRSIAPLKPAPDAVIIDTTGLTFDEVLSSACAVIDDKIERE
jgi:cytidylate kinase